jgi:BioD-like phosphotransacetylase family protein
MPKRLFIAATLQNDGKTTMSLGLIEAFKKRVGKVGFIKPVGQRYVEWEGNNVDEDSVLIGELCGADGSLKDMSPITVERGFTEWYIRHGRRSEYVKVIQDAFERVSAGKDLVVIEGTGHAGVGSCFDLSNAAVANLLGAKVVLITSGGVGRPIDEIMLNAALFEKEKAPLMGVIVNKVLPAKYDRISEVVRLGLRRKGMDVFGVLPFQEVLSKPTVGEILDELKLGLLCGDAYLDRRVDNVLVGAMEPSLALSYFEPDSLLITPGSREDIVTAVISWHLLKCKAGHGIAGLVLTGGQKPRKQVLKLLRQSEIPTLQAEADTFGIAAKIHNLTIKIKPHDLEKRDAAVEIVEQYVDVDRILESI